MPNGNPWCAMALDTTAAARTLQMIHYREGSDAASLW